MMLYLPNDADMTTQQIDNWIFRSIIQFCMGCFCTCQIAHFDAVLKPAVLYDAKFRPTSVRLTSGFRNFGSSDGINYGSTERKF